MIEWDDYVYPTAKVGDLLLYTGGAEPDVHWSVDVDSGATLGDGFCPTLDAAKRAAEQFAREWVAAQAAALSPGEWTSVVPTGPGYYWQRTPASDENELNPDTWTDMRLQWWNRPSLIGVLGCVIQFWSVPVEPPPLSEATDEP